MIAAAALLLVASAATAETMNCGSDRSEATRMACALADLKDAEATLEWSLEARIRNARINDEAAPRSPTRESFVLEAQEAWLVYRETHCDGQYLGSLTISLEDVNRVWCRTRLTKERAAELVYDFIVD